MFLIIGQYNSSLTDYLSRHNIDYTVLKDKNKYPHDPAAVDFSIKKNLFLAVDSLPLKPYYAYAVYEQYITITAEINQHLGHTNALSYKAALLSTDKVLMRQAFSKYPGISPDFQAVSSLNNIENFAARHSFPLILKPANLSKSLLVTRCNTIEELRLAAQESFAKASQLYKKYTLYQTPRFILEEYMVGTIHTVAAFVDRLGKIYIAEGIADNVSAQEMGFDDNFIYRRSLPTSLSASQQQAVYECSTKAIKALELRSCPAHVELIMTAQGVRIIEIGARLGGYRPRMYSYSYGTDLLEAALTVTEGNTPRLKSDFQAYCAVYEIFPSTTGIFVSLEGLAETGQYKYFSLKVKPGQKIGPAKDGYKACAVIIVSSLDKKIFTSLCNTVDRIYVKLS